MEGNEAWVVYLAGVVRLHWRHIEVYHNDSPYCVEAAARMIKAMDNEISARGWSREGEFLRLAGLEEGGEE